MRTGFWRKLFFITGVTLLSVSLATIDTNPEGLLVKSITIDVVNDDGSSSQEKLPALQTKENLLFSQNEFDQDLKFVSKEFDKVEPDVSVENGEVVVRLRVWKKPLIRNILWKGNSAIRTEKLKKEFGIAPGTVFDKDGFSKAIQKLRIFYIKKGFFESDIDYSLLRGEDPKQVDVEIQITEGRAGYIEKIDFVNFTSDEADSIAEQLLTKEYCFYLSWLNNQGTFYKDVFRQDEVTALKFLQNEGYLDAKVTTEITPSPKNKDRIIITFTADKGEVYSLGTVSLEGETLFPEEVLRKKAGLLTGDVYSPEAVQNAATAIRNMYGAKGYIDAAVIPINKPSSSNEYTYDVTFRIEEGKQYRVGMIDVVGNTRTDTSVILHETLLEPGAIFDTTLLDKTEARLRNIGYFTNVNVYAIKSSRIQAGDSSFRDVRIEVEEVENTARITAFGGWNSIESLSGGLMIFESNFKIAGIPQIFSKGLKAIRGGGENASASVTVGTKQFKTDVSWTKPHFMDTPWTLGVDFEQNRNSYSASDYTIKSIMGRVSGRYEINALWQTGVHYRLQNARIDLHGISHKKRNRQLRREAKNDGTISAVGASLFFDSSDHPVLPKKGARSTMEAEYAGVGGKYQFFVLRYLNSVYYSPFKTGVFKVRADVQAIKTVLGTRPSRIPLDERLYLGGENTMRGYRFNMVGPHFHDTHHTPRGGMSSLLFSGEYEHPLYKKLNGFVFFDAGNVWWHEFHVGRLRYSTGLGLRFYISDTTPLSVGMGFPLSHVNKRDIQRFFFSIGVGF